MRHLVALAISGIAIICAAPEVAAEPPSDHLFLCRSPLLARDFIGSIEEVANDGVHVTDDIAQQICDHMRAGADPQCIRVDAAHLDAFESGWGGMLAITDGTTKVWFHSPDAFGWVDPNYYFHHQARLQAQGQR